MSEAKDKSSFHIDVVLPQQGLLYSEHTFDYILCKPKLMPLKSVTLEKLEKMQKEADEKLKEMQEQDQVTGVH
ncbi:unnamed protein product [Trichogramma brassicae]|uniref:BBSome-interacting protein 1 n=1 Tax=Trichogramma brassicae TaxID=86971 RepID=A0A6H5IUR1_9HYME|nr:unnamed protein product [Trichogramma brassicae]